MENEGIELLRRRGALKVLEQMLRDMTLSVLGELRADRKQSDAFVEKLESYMWGEGRCLPSLPLPHLSSARSQGGAPAPAPVARDPPPTHGHLPSRDRGH